MKKLFFNVFDGKKVNKVNSDKLVDFIKSCKGNVSVSMEENASKIKLTPAKKNWIMKTNVKAKSCVVKQNRIVAIAKNHKRRVFSTITECSKSLKIDQGNICKVLKGKRNTAGGYRFEYV